MWKLLLHQILNWFRSESARPDASPAAPVPPELAAEAIRGEIALLSEQRLRLWRATGAYEEFGYQDLSESSHCLVKAVEERIGILGGDPGSGS